jgi:hypothetical protein
VVSVRMVSPVRVPIVSLDPVPIVAVSVTSIVSDPPVVCLLDEQLDTVIPVASNNIKILIFIILN